VGYNQARLRRLNDRKTSSSGEYVLYWAQIYRRLDHNHALDYALVCARELRKPLVVYEGLRLDYPWASQRLHRFALEGMAGNARTAAQRGLNYWPFVETPRRRAKGLLSKLAARSALVVTDDYPCFIVPGQSAALARRVEVPGLRGGRQLAGAAVTARSRGERGRPPPASDPRGLRRGLDEPRGAASSRVQGGGADGGRPVRDVEGGRP
jgi:hypothetical protein